MQLRCQRFPQSAYCPLFGLCWRAMYNGIGLPTPRGSGTNGYVQRNVANVSLLGPSRRIGYHHQTQKAVEGLPNQETLGSPLARKPDPDILEHERQRKAVVLSLELEEKLRNENILSEEQIQELVTKVRTQLSSQTEVDLAIDNGPLRVNQLLQDIALQANKWKNASSKRRSKGRVGFVEQEQQPPTFGLQLDSRPVLDFHRKSLAKEKENLKLKNALGIDDDYQPGDVFRKSRTKEDEREAAQQEGAATSPPFTEATKLETEQEQGRRHTDSAKEDGELEEDEIAASPSLQPPATSTTSVDNEGEDVQKQSGEEQPRGEKSQRHRVSSSRHHRQHRTRSPSPHREKRRHRRPSKEEKDRKHKRRHRHSPR